MPSPTVFNASTNQWVHGAAISDPSGGVVIDTQARTATNGILAALRSKGIIAGATSINVGHTWNAATSQNVLRAAIADPTGGTADPELRTALNSILTVLRNRGVIAGGTQASLVTQPIFDEDTKGWSSAAIANPSGGANIDAESRTAINAALAALRSRGFIAQD